MRGQSDSFDPAGTVGTAQKADRELASLFDDHIRSRAALQLMLLRSKGWIGDSDLEPLSDDFRRATEPPSWED